MRSYAIVFAAALIVLAWSSAAVAQNCWCGNGYNDPMTNLLEAQVWAGSPDGMGTSTWMDFIYTTDGSDPKTSGTAVTVVGSFLKFEGGNDWYQAWATADCGETVKWFARAQSDDGVVCESEVYEYVACQTGEFPPNLVGNCESELGVPGDWQNSDDLSKMWDPDLDGIFEVTLTATADFAPNPGDGYQVVETSGLWPPNTSQYPGDSNIPISFTTGEQITFYLDTNAVPGWYPESNAVWDSKLAAGGHTWAAVGDWQGWDPASTETEMTDIGGGIFCYIHCFGAVDTTYSFKCAADDGWALQCGSQGYGSNCNTLQFNITGNEGVAFYLDTNTGRIMVDYAPGPSGAEDESWGSIKSMYR